jgi:hypothetical protein
MLAERIINLYGNVLRSSAVLLLRYVVVYKRQRGKNW